jgi:hypothetical protein
VLSSGSNAEILKLCYATHQRKVRTNTDWPGFLDIARRAYAAGVEPGLTAPATFRLVREMPLASAESIINSIDDYPMNLVRMAEDRWRQEIARRITPVAVVSRKERWFMQSVLSAESA